MSCLSPFMWEPPYMSFCICISNAWWPFAYSENVKGSKSSSRRDSRSVSSKAFLITYILTHSMEQSPSWEANWFSASQEIPHILWNPKVHCRVYKSPPPVPVLRQINPVHAPHHTSWRSILTLSFRLHLGLTSGFIPLACSHQHPVCTSLLPRTYYTPRPSHSFWFHRPNNIWWGVRIVELLII